MNKIFLLGRLTKDPDIRYTQTTNAIVVKFTLAVNRRFVAQGEERQADFFNITAWNKLGEFCSKHLKKGQQISIVGRLQNQNWTDEDGTKHYSTEIIAEEIYFAGETKKTDESILNSSTPINSNESNDFIEDDLPF